MGRYEVTVHTGASSLRERTRARSADAAVHRVASGLLDAGRPPGDLRVLQVRRLRRLGRSRLVVPGGGPGPDDGTAGVREPRRPLPAPPSLNVALDEPRTP